MMGEDRRRHARAALATILCLSDPSGSGAIAMRYVLYQRDDCPLCDAAVDVLAAARLPEFDSQWIDGNASLEAHYGIRVPVLRDIDTDRELDWPFNAADVREFLL